MQFSISQKINLVLLKLAIRVLSVIEVIGTFKTSVYIVWLKVLALSIYASFILSHPTITTLLNQPHLLSDLTYLTDYAITTMYTVPNSTRFGQHFNKLGPSSQKLQPVHAANLYYPHYSVKSAIAVDVNTDTILYEYNKDLRLAPASTTKLMTALVALDVYDAGDSLSVPNSCTSIESTKAWLPAEETYQAQELIKVMLIGSAGDAACVLASGKISYQEFMQRMNDKAKDLGMTQTKFTNPIGLDSAAGNHYSTVMDLYKLGKYAMTNAQIRKIVKTREYTVDLKSINLYNKITNTNRLLWDIPGTVGVKTGKTEEAGEVLVYAYKDAEKYIIIIVMGSNQRFLDTASILNWILANYTWELT